MNKTFLYLAERFKKTKWPYHSHSYARYIIGESFKSDLKELREKGMIKPTMGINGWMIEIINEQNWTI